ncbi:MAG: helix-turn-helix domain-containing protein [Planctomycetes bacterium]|nr:helix-turn-helix domain-containing protein [Planctomycetota bacterium]
MTPIELERLADAVAERVAARLATVDTDALVDVYRAAELIGCSVPTIERLTRSGVIPSMKIGRLRRYRPSDLLGKSKGGAA